MLVILAIKLTNTMNNKYFLILLGAMAVSCSNDDNNNGENSSSANFLPLENGNYWVYEVESTNLNGRDSLYTTNDTTINGNTYRKFTTELMPYGFYSNALRNNGVRSDNGKLMISGIPDIGIPDLPIEVNLTDFVLLDQNAAIGTTLSSISNNTQQTFEGITLDISYVLSTKAGETHASYTTVNGTSYTNVKTTVLSLNLTVNASMPGFPISVPVLPSQNVVTSVQYYAENIGMIYNETNIEYQLGDTFGIELPIPSSASEQQQEILVDYNAE